MRSHSSVLKAYGDVPATGHVLQDFLQDVLQDSKNQASDVPATGHVLRDKVLTDIIDDIDFLTRKMLSQFI